MFGAQRALLVLGTPRQPASIDSLLPGNESEPALLKAISPWLAAHTKVAGWPILVDGDTRSALVERGRFEPLGEVSLKGRARSVEVFALPADQKIR